jgi:hypothetical protein
MPNLFWVVPYVMAGGVMWFVAYQMAPIGREIPLGHAIVAVFFMGACGVASGMFLKPLIGNWRVLAEFAADTLVVMGVLRLSFSRSLLAVLVYWIVMIVAVVVIALVVHSHKGSSNQSVERTGACYLAEFEFPGHWRLAPVAKFYRDATPMGLRKGSVAGRGS